MKIQEQPNGSLFILLPRAIVKGFSWKKGDILEHKITGASKLELCKGKNADNKTE